MASANRTIDHDEIRRGVEARRGRRQLGRIKGPDDLIAIDGIDRATARTIAQQVDFG